MRWWLFRICVAAVLAITNLSQAPASAQQPTVAVPVDPIVTEIGRLTTLVQRETRTDELWTQIKPASETALADATRALDAGRRFAAIERLAAARATLGAAVYVGAQAPAGRNQAALEIEWTRLGTVLSAELAPGSTAAVSVRPALVRALSEAALSQVRAFYEAGLEYGRNTTPESGLYYLGSAQAQHDWLAFARGLPPGPLLTPPRFRALTAELDGLEADLLRAYRPPASIERHRDFITASATVKDARELDTKGLRFGAMLRYLQASARVALLQPAPAAIEPATLLARLKELNATLSADRLDHSVARLFVEQAHGALDAATPATPPTRAAAIVDRVLPHYLAALAPTPARAAPATPRVTITLVRWPFT